MFFLQAALAQLHYPCGLPFPPVTLYTATASKMAPMTFPSCRKYLLIRFRELRCSARRRVRYVDEDDDEEDDEEYGHNIDIAMLEAYTESVRSVVLLIRATVDGEQEEVLIFKGFSSRLSGRTATDLSKSVLPAKAVIESIDVIKGPFDPSNIEYLEKDLTWEAFKTRFQTI